MTEHFSLEAVHVLKRRCRDASTCSDIVTHVDECDSCRILMATLLDSEEQVQDLNNKTLSSKDHYSEVIDKVFCEVIDESSDLEVQRLMAGRLVTELGTLSHTQRKLLVDNSTRYQTWGVAEQLLSDCRAGWSDDPKYAESLADLALSVIDHLACEGFKCCLLADLRAEAWSYVANCRRIRFDLTGAAEAFDQSELNLALGSGDTAEKAQLMDLKASYFGVRGDFEAAAVALDDAIRGYRLAGDSHLEGRSCFLYAKVLYDSGRIGDALSALDRAFQLVDASRDPYLSFQLKWTKLVFLTRLGDTDEACRILPEVRELARERAPRLERLRFLWTEAILRRKLGQVELAEEALKQVREGYIAAEITADVALVSLELASLYLEMKRTEEVRCLALETMPLFASRGVHREVLMAWSLFKEAADQDAATIQLVGEVATRIRRVKDRRLEDHASTP